MTLSFFGQYACQTRFTQTNFQISLPQCQCFAFLESLIGPYRIEVRFCLRFLVLDCVLGMLVAYLRIICLVFQGVLYEVARFS